MRLEWVTQNFPLKPMTPKLLALFTCLALISPSAGAGLSIGQLRCESLTEPLGIHELHPRLSWIVESSRRGDRQTAYQLLVANTLELLVEGKADLWDSGKISSDETSQIAYRGKELASRARCFWKVKSWDMDGEPSEWSESASWSIGLLDEKDWSAKWIEAAVEMGKVRPEILIATYEAVDGSGSVDLTPKLKDLATAGAFSVKVENTILGDDPAPEHLKHLRVEFRIGERSGLKLVDEHATFEFPHDLLDPTVPYLRKSFSTTKPLTRATLYATALGIYEMSLNGHRAGDHLLAPEWTDYRKRLRYQAYDVTALVASGKNVIAAQVANGWYAGHIGNGGYQYWGKQPALFAQLELDYADGSSERIVTDGSWRTHPSPLLSSDFMKGESYDARNELDGWNKAALDDSGWESVSERAEKWRPLDGQVMQPVRQLAVLKTKKLTEPRPGKWTFDLGQNMVGVVRLKISGPAGTRITLRHGEMLDANGSLYTANLRGAPSVDTYICKGKGVEIWQPQFTFHGFRYVELTGTEARPSDDAVTGIVIGSDTPKTGEFHCSDARVNQLQSNIEWGQRGNYLSVPTDCPQRDERLGWMGDAQVFVRTATYNADVAAFFSKWLVDVDDSQESDGRFSDVSPSSGGVSSGTPAWGDAGVICPWTIYQAYADKRLLEKHYPAMVKWIEWCSSHSTDSIREKDRGNDYGDWLSIGADTPKDLIGTAYYAYSTSLMANAAAVLGKTDEAIRYEKLFQTIKTAFIAKYITADGHLTGGTQCAYVMALKFDLLPENLRVAAAQHLEADIVTKGDHLSTGFVGVSYLLPTLTKANKSDVAYRLLLQDSFPSWLFSVKHGATTIWERWDGWTPDKGFQDIGMNSFNHYSLGSCGEWLYGSVAGIDHDAAHPGFKEIIIHPQPGGGLTSASGKFQSIHGHIVSAWSFINQSFTLDVSIPTNTRATVYVPASAAEQVTESGKPAASAEGVSFLRLENGSAVFAVKSGKYQFVSTALPLAR